MASTGWTYSEHYMWKRTNLLGRGSFGEVFQGVHQMTGQPVAIKCFFKPDIRGMKRPALLHMIAEEEKKQMKELELLRELDHENIIKLIAIQTEKITKDRVAILELGQGGSLHRILSDPENVYGMKEEEFLLLLKHTTAGLKYLRDRNISHRDIKPGNILLFITEEGRHIYKLADFGTARVILENQTFQTICGTEEYLCPYMYEKVLVEKVESQKRDFSPMMDLWSMGCTFYQAATGSLPFQPYLSSKNRKGMYEIHKNKAPGIIAAIQDKDGNVDWKEDLPDSCLLSSDLQKTLVFLLQKLLTKEASLSFKEYFVEMEEILSRKAIHIFDVQHCREHTFYVDPNSRLSSLQIQIQKQTGVKVDEQILIQKGVSLEKADLYSPVCNLVKETCLTDPVFLLPSSQLDLTSAIDQFSSSPLKVDFPKFESSTGIKSDVYVAEHCTGEAYVVARHVASLSRRYGLLLNMPSSVTSVIEREIEHLSQHLQQIMGRLEVLDCIFKSMEKQMSIVVEFLSLLGPQTHKEVQSMLKTIKQGKSELILIHDRLIGVHKIIQNLQTKCESGRRNQDRSLDDSQKILVLNQSKERADNFVKSIRSSWTALDKLQKSPNIEIADCNLEKIRVKQSVFKLLALYKDCSSAFHNVMKGLQPSFCEMQQKLSTCKEVRFKLNHGVSMVKSFEAMLKGMEDQCEKMLSLLISNAKKVKALQVNDQLKGSGSTALLVSKLQELGESQQQMKTIIKENASLTQKFLNFSEELRSEMNNSKTTEQQIQV